MLGWKFNFINLVLVLVSSLASAGLTVEDYEVVTKRLSREFAPDIARMTKGRSFEIKYDFNNDVTGISNFLNLILVGGGYKNIASMNRDVFSLLLCHEIGQILGGAPFLGNRSVKGQSDYFATSKCLPRLWKMENNIAIVRRWVFPKEFAMKCSKSFSNPNRVALCIRTAIASQFLAIIYHDLTPNKEEGAPAPHYKTHDPFIDHSGTYIVNSPSNQCRLDTMLAGAYCNVNPYMTVNILSSSLTGCPTGLAARPRCWYQPEVSP